MFAIGSGKLSDAAVMDALVPCSAAGLDYNPEWPRQERAISIRGSPPGRLPARRSPPPGAATASSACASRAARSRFTPSTARLGKRR